MVQAQRKPTSVGDILMYEYLEPTGLRINDLADMLQVHRNTVSKLLNNNSKLTTDMAFRLAKVFETTVEFWLNVQTNMDIWEIVNDPRTQEEIGRIVTLREMQERKAAGKTQAA